MPVSHTTTSVQDTYTVSLAGEIDMATTADALSWIQEAVDAAPRRLEVDLRQLSFLDSTGIRMLVDAHAYAAARDVLLVVVNPQPMIAKVLHVTGVAPRLGLV